MGTGLNIRQTQALTLGEPGEPHVNLHRSGITLSTAWQYVCAWRCLFIVEKKLNSWEKEEDCSTRGIQMRTGSGAVPVRAWRGQQRDGEAFSDDEVLTSEENTTCGVTRRCASCWVTQQKPRYWLNVQGGSKTNNCLALCTVCSPNLGIHKRAMDMYRTNRRICSIRKCSGCFWMRSNVPFNVGCLYILNTCAQSQWFIMSRFFSISLFSLMSWFQ